MTDKQKQSKGFWSKILDKLDETMKTKAKQSSCGCCCSSEDSKNTGKKAERGQGCC